MEEKVMEDNKKSDIVDIVIEDNKYEEGKD